jgi:RNA polymerase sigma-70 factor (ECF subfamily)
VLYKNKEIVNGFRPSCATIEKKPEMESKIKLLEGILISKLKSGDISAFSTIFSSYYRDLVFFASRYTRDHENAEEIVQDTFVKIWENHKFIEIDVSLKSYLLKAVQNKCIDMIRHNKIKNAHNRHVLENSLQNNYETDNYVLFSELQEQLGIALNNLPEELSYAFTMSRNKGLKYDEIAKSLNVSVRTIEVRIGKALHILRYQLKEYL